MEAANSGEKDKLKISPCTVDASGNITVDLAQNGATEKDPKYGYGRIDAFNALLYALSVEPRIYFPILSVN